jgi:hypothetical protein
VSTLKNKIPSKNMREKPSNTPIIHSVINKLNKQWLHLLVFHAYIYEIHGSRSKIPSKKSRQAALRGGI